MDEFTRDITEAAADAVAVAEHVFGEPLDFSPASLAVVEEILAEAPDWTDELDAEQTQNLARAFGCYVLEVGRREFGGRYCWHEGRDQPVLVVGEPAFRVAILTWDKVSGRLAGDAADNIPFFYAGFADRVRRAEPGADVLYV